MIAVQIGQIFSCILYNDKDFEAKLQIVESFVVIFLSLLRGLKEANGTDKLKIAQF